MCGIAGIFLRNNPQKPPLKLLQDMAGILSHRGPDEQGVHVDSGIGFAQSRLSIIDIAGGHQPMFNEDGTIALIFNGEIFNYIELGEILRKKGHIFKTRSDTEVIIHAYEEYGSNFLSHLNGQFAIALWDGKAKKLVLGRDRVGIRPLFYAELPDGTFLFASESKALFCHPDLKPEMDPAGLNQIFTLWVNIPPRTIFKNIFEVPPAHMITINADQVHSQRYWKLTFPRQYDVKSLSYYKETLSELLLDAVSIRLRADVPVAAYLSGGIDSSIITSLVKKYHNNEVMTFSVAFSDRNFDERSYQQQMVSHLQTDHRMIEADDDTIAAVMPEVLWFSEKPLIRTAPAPLYILSGLVRSNGIKVVLTGEGADEVFGGYNIFKEDKIRRFWARYPDSRVRPLLLSKLYPYINSGKSSAQNFWQLFFKKNLDQTDNLYYSHLIRWNNTAQIKKFFTPDLRSQMNEEQIFEELNAYVDPDMRFWHPFTRAQYLEMQLFMSGYLLSSQGDRMMMGHSVEGRFPFLDYRVIEFASSIPPFLKMNVLNEKYILKETFGHLLPQEIVKRDKQPYRAPISGIFRSAQAGFLNQMLEESTLAQSGYFDSKSVQLLFKKIMKGGQQAVAARDEMAIFAIASTQVIHKQYIEKMGSPLVLNNELSHAG